MAFIYEAMTAFNLTDAIKYSMTVPGGISNITWFFVINEDKRTGVSEEDRAAIDAISGEVFAERVGQAWKDADTAAEVEPATGSISIGLVPRRSPPWRTPPPGWSRHGRNPWAIMTASRRCSLFAR